MTPEELNAACTDAEAYPESVLSGHVRALLDEADRLRALLQRWRFEQHDVACPCKLCAATAEALPGVPYHPDRTENSPVTPERLAEIRGRLDSTRGDLPADPRCPGAVPNLHMTWYAQDVGELLALAEREQFVRDNAPSLLAERDALIARQRAELAKLNQRCAGLTEGRDRLRAELDETRDGSLAWLAEQRGRTIDSQAATKRELQAEIDRLRADLESVRACPAEALLESALAERDRAEEAGKRLREENHQLRADLENERHRGRVEHDAGAVG